MASTANRGPLVVPIGPRPIRTFGRRAALVASSVRVTTAQAKRDRSAKQSWQTRALDYYDTLGEVWYAAQFYARALAKLDLYVAREDADGELEKVTDRPDVTDVLDALRDDAGGREQLQASFGRLWFLVGEAFLVATWLDAEEGAGDGVRWEMLSSMEIDVTETGIKRRTTPGAQPEELVEVVDGKPPEAGQVMVWRLWRPHPRWSGLADSPMRGVLELCEELVLASQRERATIRSRLAGAGILFVPEEVSPPPPDADAGDEDAQADKFLRDLTDSMIRAIEDEQDAAAVVPLLVRVGSDFVDSFRHLRFDQVTDPPDKRRDLIARFALGIDMPAEVFTGMGAANHWSAWQITREAWSAHAEPVAMALCGELTRSLLRPTLKAAGVADWADFTVWYDATRVVQHPDRGKDAMEAYDRGAIDAEALREAKGFDENDKMDDDEYARWVGVQVGDAAMAVDGTPTPAPEPAAFPAPADTQPAGGDGNAAPDSGPPSTEDANAAAAAIMAFQVERCRERAGSRVRSRLGDSPTARGIASRALCAHLGRAHVESLGFTAKQLVSGDGDCALSVSMSHGFSAGRARSLVEQAERIAADRLYAEP